MGIHFRRKTDFFPEEDTTMSYSGFEPEPTRLQAKGRSYHTGWATFGSMTAINIDSHLHLIDPLNYFFAYVDPLQAIRVPRGSI
ncbi:hypothetical protein TNCV_3324541 [Trichonephila clavipes]|nr:hypothetical protein TNCV_3324541 [Trichonephila clavipes]